MSVAELRRHVDATESDASLQMRLEAVEAMIQGVTNNNFSRYKKNGCICYPADIKMGVINLIRWDLEYRDKVGVASETISRHSVTYVAQDDANTNAGYPAALMGFLKPYHKARFGQGLRV